MARTPLDDHYQQLNPGKTKDFRTFSAAAKILDTVGDNDGNILDIGCGFGILVAMATQKGRRITGLDTSPYMIEGSQEYLKTLRIDPNLVSLTTIEKLAEQGAVFDSITMIDVLEHIEDAKGFLKVLETILAPSGHLILSVPAHPEFYDVRDEMLGHFRRYDRAALLDDLAATQLEIRDVHYWNLLGWVERKIRQRLFSRVNTHQQYRFRYSRSLFMRFLNHFLRAYFFTIENRIRPVRGLTLILVAQKPAAGLNPERAPSSRRPESQS